MLVLEPIFEADLPPEIYAYRAVRVDQADLMSLARPVDADEPSRIVRHHFASRSLPGHHDARHSLYWRSGRNSPPDLHRSQPAGARVPPGARNTGGKG